MAHRGPDDAGVWWSEDACVALAHRRLAVIDLTAAARQPMQDRTKRSCITFNGEVYNHQELRQDLEDRGHSFQSESDTEVILEAYHEWGAQCLERLNGMFAFGLYDKERQLLFIARDRAGEKPLFYRRDECRFSFASELKALLADPDIPRKLDLEAMKFYLAFGYVPGDRCILQGFNKLPPAHAATFDVRTGKFRRWQYWELPPPKEESGPLETATELVEELEHLLQDSVRKQLIADVPVGILLSGGVDSSLVTAMAAKTGRSVKTFTIRFPDYGPYDETHHARLIANHFATEHVELRAEPSTVDLLPALARQFDEPIVDSSMIPTFLVCRLVRQHCTVALGGDGGDELFGGYEHYSRLLRLEQSFRFIPHAGRTLVATAASSLLPLGFRGRNWLMQIGLDPYLGPPHNEWLFDKASRAWLLHPNIARHRPEECLGQAVLPSPAQRCTPVVDQATRTDFLTYLPENILAKVDRASMLSSLEMRAPLLDYRIIEFAFRRVPAFLKAQRHGKKILLKILGRRLLPSGFDWDRKQGFSIPLATWLRNEWKTPFSDLLFQDNSPIFRREAVEKLWAGHQRGRSNSERLFAVALFELWRHAHKILL